MSFRCPHCKAQDRFVVTATTWVRVNLEGDVLDNQGAEWHDGSNCHCCACSHRGTVGEFTVTADT